MRARASVWTVEGDDLESVRPIDPAHAGQWIRVLAGPEDGPGEESFDLFICTPAWIADEVARTGAVVGRHHVIVGRWEPHQVRKLVVDLFTRDEAKDWDELGPRLSRLGHWEFEDYRDR